MGAQDSSSGFIKTPQQLIVAVVLGFVIPVFAVILIVRLVVDRPGADPAAMTPEAIAARIRPVAAPVAASAAPNAPAAGAPAAAGKADGKKVYDTACVACHATGAANAPKLGDKSAWAPRLKTGIPALVKSAMTGKGAMPPKGGNAALSEAELRAAVEYMAAQSR